MTYDPSTLRDACVLVPVFLVMFTVGAMTGYRIRNYAAMREAFNRGRKVEAGRINLLVIRAKHEAFAAGKAEGVRLQQAAKFYSHQSD